MQTVQPRTAGALHRSAFSQFGPLRGAVLDRENDEQCGAARRRAFNDERPAKGVNALAHDGEAEARRRVGADAVAVVLDGEMQRRSGLELAFGAGPPLFEDLDPDRARLAVADGVGHALPDSGRLWSCRSPLAPRHP